VCTNLLTRVKGLKTKINANDTVNTGLLTQDFCGLAVRASQLHDDVLFAYLCAAQMAGLHSCPVSLGRRKKVPAAGLKAPAGH
jgi:hypothetical protein